MIVPCVAVFSPSCLFLSTIDSESVIFQLAWSQCLLLLCSSFPPKTFIVMSRPTQPDPVQSPFIERSHVTGQKIDDHVLH